MSVNLNNLHKLCNRVLLLATVFVVFVASSTYSYAKEISIDVGVDANDIEASGISAEYVGTAYIGKKLNKSDFVVKYKYLSLEGNVMLGKTLSVDDFSIEPDIATSEEVDILVNSGKFDDDVLIHAIPFPINTEPDKKEDKDVIDNSSHKEEKIEFEAVTVDTDDSSDYLSTYTEEDNSKDIDGASRPRTGDSNILLYWYIIFILSIALSTMAYFKMHNKGDKGLL